MTSTYVRSGIAGTKPQEASPVRQLRLVAAPSHTPHKVWLWASEMAFRNSGMSGHISKAEPNRDRPDEINERLSGVHSRPTHDQTHAALLPRSKRHAAAYTPGSP